MKCAVVAACEHTFVTARGHARAQFGRAIERKNLVGAEMALREMGAVDLLEASTTSPCSPSSVQRKRRARPCAGTAGWKLKRRC
jgi:hypothetical protein